MQFPNTLTKPSHARGIGDEMLSGAVLGATFASPSVAAVLEAIRNVYAYSDDSPVFLMFKNYTGDLLNFGMACEKAKMEGIECAMVVVADDCALDRSKDITITGARRVVGGNRLVHKIVGAAAAMVKSLDEVAALAKEVCGRMGTSGVALDADKVPRAPT